MLREIRPQVVVTFGPEGLYGHPDHIAISQWTTSALVGAGDACYPGAEELEPHRIAKLYYRTGTAEWFEHYMPLFGDLIMHIDGRERRATPWQPWIITTRLDTRAYWQQVWDAVHCHQTQLRYRHKLQDVTEWLQLQLWGQQEYYRVLSLVNGGREEEHDLFEGLRPAQYVLSQSGREILLDQIQEAEAPLITNGDCNASREDTTHHGHLLQIALAHRPVTKGTDRAPIGRNRAGLP